MTPPGTPHISHSDPVYSDIHIPPETIIDDHDVWDIHIISLIHCFHLFSRESSLAYILQSSTNLYESKMCIVMWKLKI